MIILRQKRFSEELKALIAQRTADKAAGKTSTPGSAAAQLDQMKANTANLNAIKDAERSARREAGKTLESQIKTAAQTGNTAQKTQLLNSAQTAGTQAGYKKATDLLNNNNNTGVSNFSTKSRNNAIQNTTQSVGIKQGAINTWKNMNDTQKSLAIGGAAVATLGTGMMIARNRNKRKEAERKLELERARNRY